MRRELAIAVVLSAVGGGLALFGASRQWWVSHTPRPAPFPPLTKAVSGGEVVPWVPAMGFVGLAGAAALLATRRLGRLVVGVLLVFAGVSTLIGGVVGLQANPDFPSQQLDASTFPPLLTVCAGALMVCAGLVTSLRFRSWQTKRAGLGTRYDSPVSTRARAESPTDSAQLWDSLDRGHDPTIDPA